MQAFKLIGEKFILNHRIDIKFKFKQKSTENYQRDIVHNIRRMEWHIYIYTLLWSL